MQRIKETFMYNIYEDIITSYNDLIIRAKKKKKVDRKSIIRRKKQKKKEADDTESESQSESQSQSESKVDIGGKNSETIELTSVKEYIDLIDSILPKMEIFVDSKKFKSVEASKYNDLPTDRDDPMNTYYEDIFKVISILFPFDDEKLPKGLKKGTTENAVNFTFQMRTILHGDETHHMHSLKDLIDFLLIHEYTGDGKYSHKRLYEILDLQLKEKNSLLGREDTRTTEIKQLRVITEMSKKDKKLQDYKLLVNYN